MITRVVTCTADILLVLAGHLSAQTRIITGRVMDSLTQETVTSGQVVVTGTTTSGIIRDDGTFTLAVPPRDVVLQVRSIGFKRKDVAVPAAQNAVDVSLARDYFQLEAIVVTGQATGVERKNLANAVSTVTAEQLVKAATVTVDQALQGKLAGAQIISHSGAPGGGMMMKLRGMTSVLGNSQPLWVVDGVIISNAEIGNGMNQVTRGGGQSCSASGLACGTEDQVVNRASDLNPNDIQSVEVLKGASAAAIYGSKANNGVILITTKRGRIGAPQFNLTQRVGVSTIAKRLGPFRKFESADEAAEFFGPQALVDWTPNYYDHEMELFGGHPLSYETSGSMSGGTETTRYFASALIKRDGGILLNTNAQKQSLRLNIDQTVGSRLKFGFSTNAIHSYRQPGWNNNDNFEVSMYMTLPVTPTWLDIRQRPDGTWPVMPYANSNIMQTETVAENNENVWRFIGAGQMTLDLVQGAQHTLRLTGNGGADFFTKRDFVFSPADLQFEPKDGFAGTVVRGSSYNNQMNVTGSLVHTYKAASGAFSATTSIGAQYEQRSFNFAQIWGRNLTSGVANVDETTDPTVQQTRSEVRDAGYFAQEEVLMLNERLLLTAGIRADQSSTNSDPTQLFYYPKFAASFRTSPIRGLLDEVKFRAAYGQSGNEPTYGSKFNQLTTASIEGITTAGVGSTLIGPLRPERQEEIEAGVDATLLGGRANLELTGYQRNIRDLLINRSLLSSTGFTTARFNGATLRTRGLEVALTAVPVQTPAVQWQARTTFSFDRSVITKLPVPPFRAAGSFSFGAAWFEEDSSATQVYANDTVGGKVVQHKIGDLNPDFTVGFNTDLRVKSLSFNMLWNWQQGGMTSNLTRWLFDLAGTTRDYTEPCIPGDCLPGETLGGQRSRLFPSRVARINIESTTYLKLREATLSWELPRGLVDRIWGSARYIRLSLSGRNLLQFTPYSGVDPEVSTLGSSRNPPIGFNDIAPYPPSRTFLFSLDLGF